MNSKPKTKIFNIESMSIAPLTYDINGSLWIVCCVCSQQCVSQLQFSLINSEYISRKPSRMNKSVTLYTKKQHIKTKPSPKNRAKVGPSLKSNTSPQQHNFCVIVVVQHPQPHHLNQQQQSTNTSIVVVREPALALELSDLCKVKWHLSFYKKKTNKQTNNKHLLKNQSVIVKVLFPGVGTTIESRVWNYWTFFSSSSPKRQLRVCASCASCLVRVCFYA